MTYSYAVSRELRHWEAQLPLPGGSDHLAHRKAIGMQVLGSSSRSMCFFWSFLVLQVPVLQAGNAPENHLPASSVSSAGASPTLSDSSSAEASSNPLSATALFNLALQSAERMNKDLGQFVCHEQIDRFKGSTKREQSHQVDVITSLVSYDAGEEHYSDILQNNRRLSRIGALRGAWSEGEYGTFLREAMTIFNSKPVRFLSMSTLEGQPAAVYAFDLSPDESPWDIQVSGKHYILPFHGQLWVSPTTGNILQIDRISTSVSSETGISGVNWSVSFGPMEVDGKSSWLPAKAVYSVTYWGSDRHEWNRIAFSGYRRFGSEVVVHFE